MIAASVFNSQTCSMPKHRNSVSNTAKAHGCGLVSLSSQEKWVSARFNQAKLYAKTPLSIEQRGSGVVMKS